MQYYVNLKKKLNCTKEDVFVSQNSNYVQFHKYFGDCFFAMNKYSVWKDLVDSTEILMNDFSPQRKIEPKFIATD